MFVAANVHAQCRFTSEAATGADTPKVADRIAAYRDACLNALVVGGRAFNADAMGCTASSRSKMAREAPPSHIRQCKWSYNSSQPLFFAVTPVDAV